MDMDTSRAVPYHIPVLFLYIPLYLLSSFHPKIRFSGFSPPLPLEARKLCIYINLTRGDHQRTVSYENIILPQYATNLVVLI